MGYFKRIIMKIIILLSMPLFIFASGQTLNYEEHGSLHTYNKRPTMKSKIRSRHHKLHKVNEKQARAIAKENTGEEVKNINLTHKGKYLMFRIQTEHYNLKINALDGTIITKEKIDA